MENESQVYKTEYKEPDFSQFNTPQTDLAQISGLIPTVSTAPTHTPRKLGEQFRISGSDFYYFDTTNNAWKHAMTIGGTDLTVPDGGTGASSFTAYAVICGGTTATGALQSIAGVGTSGQVLTSNGAGALPTFQNASSGGDLVKTCFASDFQTSGATVQYQTNDGDNVNVVKFTNGNAQNALCTVKVPSGGTSISSIKVYYQRKTTGNLYLVFKTTKIDNDSIAAITADNTDSLTTYASGGSDGSIESLTVPSAAYNGLGSIDADDIVSIDIRRDASSATDTYEADWQVVAVQFTFA